MKIIDLAMAICHGPVRCLACDLYAVRSQPAATTLCFLAMNCLAVSTATAASRQ